MYFSTYGCSVRAGREGGAGFIQYIYPGYRQGITNPYSLSGHATITDGDRPPDTAHACRYCALWGTFFKQKNPAANTCSSIQLYHSCVTVELK